jgi:hypothetical protein
VNARAKPDAAPDVLIALIGAPYAVEGLIPEYLGIPTNLETSIVDAHLAVAPGGSGCFVRVTLPPATPAGEYEAALITRDRRLPAILDVLDAPHLLAMPSQLRLSVETREVLTQLTLVNDGNVSVEIGRAYGLGLFEQHGLERVIGTGLRASKSPGSDRLTRILDEAADAHGGLVRIAVRNGAGTLKPGDQRTLRLQFRFGDQLSPGRTYTGTIALANLHYPVAVTVGGKRVKQKVGVPA